MATTRIPPQRISLLNARSASANGDYVLYWMQASMRAEHNPALEFAVQRANALGKRLLVAFGIMDDYPQANLRHYKFMIQGLVDVETALRRRKIKFVVQHGHPAEVAAHLGRGAAEIVCDRGYLRHQKQWREKLATEVPVCVTQIEADAVVPVHQVSDKAEHAARTIRPKIAALRDHYLVELRSTPVRKNSLNLSMNGLDLSDIDALLNALELDRSVPPVDFLFTGGAVAARRVLEQFLAAGFSRYEKHRNQPQTDDVSYMSMYLHFGMISPVALALAIRDTHAGSGSDRASYLEELIVRRELSLNFCEFCDDYARYHCLPGWARTTLDDHRGDPRDHVYTRTQFEDAQTHDPYWNAAMRELRYTGYMHNYIRMYWGKKIIEWTNTPEYAFQTTLYLNNRYFLDGRDPNSYANVAWIFGRHDRGWTERAVFGKVRYMNANGLQRKCRPDEYVRKVDALVARAKENGAA